MLSKPTYIICDFEILQNKQISLEEFLKYCDNLDIAYIQYRDNISNLESQKNNLIFLNSNTNIPILNNKIVFMEYCDGAHLEQKDIQSIIKEELKIKNIEVLFKFLRKKYSKKIFGISVNDEFEILKANTLAIDYIELNSCKNISYLTQISKHPVSNIYEN